ncbi:MAG: shikimate kinase [Rhizobiales bacterium 65-9]|nr:shikimate kinase [Hyphomicrobiales bacterium]OJY36614.1 MAG: shikimate kinase [Rhizobiales bacterium 65-9]
MPSKPRKADALAASIRENLAGRTIVLVGMMGAGKTALGKRLAARLDMPFKDADAEIEQAAHLTIPEIFAQHGEEAFRDGERRVITRLLEEGEIVLATGGGAYMNPETRRRIAAQGVCVWLKADFETLIRRVRKRNNRPLLNGADPDETLRRLIEERYPTYAEADIAIQSREAPPELIVDEAIVAIHAFLTGAAA